ncbi:hypothetical protein [Butyrivibrio sp. INlla16]|uniref:hypothetical protein n=1 Tax=Butyrivibrio sp. INlla16 TaxID=1520807 RepID=UPI000889B6EC|nr:hypothetical protein [Butyrivibrio sp. INlla16]SDB54360.1 hypothetical protein SAMN02910263_02762 [Butyrivibrio sp. INlla16]
MVEPQEDGTYRYKGKMIFAQKDKYVSAIDLTDAIYKFAEEAVFISYFDLTDDFTYATLRDDDLKNSIDDLRSYKLGKSAVVFAPGEKEKLCKLDVLPVISDKPCYYIIPGKAGSTKKDHTDFKLTRDEHGYDSDKAYLTDKNGKKYDLEYGESVGKQLNKAGCPSGIVYITEETCYGQVGNPYEAIFIADGDNTGKLGITCYEDGIQSMKTFTQEDDGETLEVETFKISSISDELDPYSIIKVISPSNETTYYVADQEYTRVWADQGEYRISLINRLGFSFSVTINVKASEYATISFEGDGTDNIESIVTKKNEENIELPELTREGYTLLGFEDEQGIRYSKQISQISFVGNKKLKPVWEANKYKLIYKDASGKDIKAVEVEYGGKYELETFEWDDNVLFMGWTREGKLLDQGIISVDKQEDIVLIPRFEEKISSEMTLGNAQNNETEDIINSDEKDISNIEQEDKHNESDDKTVQYLLYILIFATVMTLSVLAIRKREYIKKAIGRFVAKNDSVKGDKDDEDKS